MLFSKIALKSGSIAAQRLPPFTHEVQQWIWERQNPPLDKCAAQQYLLGFLITNQVLFWI
jgi:hypothetical protein